MVKRRVRIDTTLDPKLEKLLRIESAKRRKPMGELLDNSLRLWQKNRKEWV